MMDVWLIHDWNQVNLEHDVGWANDTRWSTIEDMSVDHGGLDVAVAKQLLDGTDIVAALEEMGGERMPEGMATDGFGYSGSAFSVVDSALHDARIHVIAALSAGMVIFPAMLLGENPLPRPILAGVWIFPIEGAGNRNFAESFGEVLLMDSFDEYKVFSEFRF